MENARSTTVRIIFRTPHRENTSTGSARHERRLDSVPASVAERMVSDFERYRESREERSPLYRYERDGEEVLLALDLEEVVALTVLGDGAVVTTERRDRERVTVDRVPQ